MPFKTILVGTDGSERAAVAVNAALELAKMNDARLYAAYVVHPTVVAGFAEAGAIQIDVDEAHEEAQRIKSQLLAEAELKGMGERVSVELIHSGAGDIAGSLISLAKDVNADLVVVGNRGMSGARRFVLGSVPNSVTHHCHCSVLIVNTNTA
ncbi:MAG TPA: universal stress protein [Acidimicrobiales bacterium]|nr:universal stress protein [Acidimicrobiales bacterium]